MTTTWKPENYNSVSIYVVADNARNLFASFLH
jgi:hypothetical protein